MKIQYDSKIYFAGRAFIYYLLLMVLSLSITYPISRAINMPSLGALIFVFLCIAPFIWGKNFKNRFTQIVRLDFDKENFSIISFNIKTNNEIERHIYRWEDIKFYKVYFTPSKMTYIDLYLRSKKKKEFGFQDNKGQEESLNGESVFKIFHLFIKQYNDGKDEVDKIKLRPGFLTTKVGTSVLVGLEICLIVAGLLTIVKDGKALPFFLIAVFSSIPLFVKRKRDQELFRKLSAIE